MIDETPCFEIRPTSAYKGHGIFARRTISRGERILIEQPILSLPRNEAHGGKIGYSLLMSRFRNLDKVDQDTFLRLTTSEMSDEAGSSVTNTSQPKSRNEEDNDDQARQALLEEVFSNNMFEHPTLARGKGVAVFPTIARINHSCVPSVVAASNAEMDTMTLHAGREIEKGEEMTISYIGVARGRSERAKALDKYGFVCTCAACVDGEKMAEGSDDCRERIAELAESITKYTQTRAEDPMNGRGSGSTLFGGCQEGREAMATMRTLCELVDYAGLFGDEVAFWYQWAAVYCLESGNLADALEWLRRQLEMNAVCKGDDHPDTRETRRVMAIVERRVEGDRSLTQARSATVLPAEVMAAAA